MHIYIYIYIYIYLYIYIYIYIGLQHLATLKSCDTTKSLFVNDNIYAPLCGLTTLIGKFCLLPHRPKYNSSSHELNTPGNQ